MIKSWEILASKTCVHEKMVGVGVGVPVREHGKSCAPLPGWVKWDEDVLS